MANPPTVLPTVTLRDPDTGDDLSMYVVVEIAKNSRRYGLVASTEPIVNLFQVDNSDEASLQEVEDEDLPRYQAALAAALAEHSLSARLIGSELRLSAEIPDELWETGEYIELEGESEDEPDDYLVIAEFDADGHHCWLVSPVEPQLFAVELLASSTRLLDEAEVDALDDDFRAALDSLDGNEEEAY